MVSVEIETLAEKKMVGYSEQMSLAEDTTIKLWQKLMPQRKDIKNTISKDLYSLQIYPIGFFDDFNPHKIFEKWALVEVENFENLLETMQTFILKAGLYAHFTNKGDAKKFEENLNDFYTHWLPASGYTLDEERPHFEVLGEKYQHQHANSEEEVWIPIKK